MNDDDDLLGILLKYNSVAKRLSSSVIIKDKTMVPFLAYCLSSTEAGVEVARVALETLGLLMGSVADMSQLAATYGVLPALHLTSTRDDLPDELKVKASELYDRLQDSSEPVRCVHGRVAESHSFTLHVHGLYEEYRAGLEVAVIGVPGVVSVVVSMERQRVTMRARPDVAAVNVATAILEHTGLWAALVTRNTLGQEILKPLLEGDLNDSAEDLPPYLREEDSPVKEKAISRAFNIKETTSNWLSSAIGFFQSSFYW